MRNFQAHTDLDRAEMLKEIGIDSIDDLFTQIPQEARITKLDLAQPMNEMQVQKTKFFLKSYQHLFCFHGMYLQIHLSSLSLVNYNILKNAFVPLNNFSSNFQLPFSYNKPN